MDDKKLSSYDPSNGEVVGEVDITTVSSIPEMAAAARVTQKSWRTVSIEQRVVLEENGDRFIKGRRG